MPSIDRLSNLPEEVREKILTYLPIKEAGRTSVLSSKWRYTWTTIPELIFGDTVNAPNLVNSVDAVFVLRNGPIHKFNLSTLGYYPEAAFDRWILNLSRNKIRDLTLDRCGPGPNYKMHSSFYACNELNYVSLTNCSLKLPDWFEGFNFLHTLKLDYLEVAQGEIEKLISSCPMLRELKLSIWLDSVSLNIHAHNLMSLEICGQVNNLQICAPKLLYLGLRVILTPVNENNTGRNIEQVVGNLPDLERLKLTRIEYLYVKPLRKGYTLNRVKNLIIDLDVDDDKENAFVLSVFKAAPYLQSLDMDVYDLLYKASSYPTSKFWEMIDRKEDFFNHLQRVKLVVYGIADLGFSFVKFILESAPQLETVTIKVVNKEDESIIMTQLLQVDKAAPNVQIMFENKDVI